MAMIPAGATIRDKATGQPLGTTVAPVTINIVCNTRPLAEAIGRVQVQLAIAGAAARRFHRMFANRRLETLRHQARLKGRPGWRAIPIPRGPRFRFHFLPSIPERSTPPFARSTPDAMPPHPL